MIDEGKNIVSSFPLSHTQERRKSGVVTNALDGDILASEFEP